MGTLLQITGNVDHYRGLTEISVSDSTKIVTLGTGTIPAPMEVTVDEWLANGEMYEGSLIRIEGVAATEEGQWPSATNSASVNMWDGHTEFVFRIDSDTDLDDNPEPTYPINFVGIASQFTFSSPANDGYQVLPNTYADIEQNVPAPPNPHFDMTQETLDMYSDQTIAVNTVEDTFTFTWYSAVDLNGDALIYQLVLEVDGVEQFFDAGNDTTITLTGAQLVDALDGAASNQVMITVRTYDLNTVIVYSAYDITTTFDILVSVDELSQIPTEFYMDQNFPNPFNPSTTIKFGLPNEATVDLRVYDVLGREVAVLINQEIKSAGTYNYQFNASQLASGTYVYRLQANDKVQIKKMLLLK
jgi:hypothetical protein